MPERCCKISIVGCDNAPLARHYKLCWAHAEYFAPTVASYLSTLVSAAKAMGGIEYQGNLILSCNFLQLLNCSWITKDVRSDNSSCLVADAIAYAVWFDVPCLWMDVGENGLQ